MNGAVAPMYPVQMRDGSVEDVYLPMRDAPEIGSQVKVGRRTGTRVASSTTNQIDMRYAHCAYHMKRWDADAPHHDKDGWCYFETKAEIKEYEGKSTRLKWDV